MKQHYLFFIFIFSLSIHHQVVAGPNVKLCVNDNCKHPVYLKLRDSTWSSIKDLYKMPFQTDKDEQDNIANSIIMMESEIYSSLASQDSEKQNAEDLYANNSKKNNYRNVKAYLGVLLDNHLVTRHFMRKTISITRWNGMQETGLLLQSLESSQLYLLQINHSELGSSPIINLYKKGDKNFHHPQLQHTDTTEKDDDLE